MKKLFLLLTIFLCGFTYASAQQWVGVDKNTPAKIQETLVSSSEEEIIVDVKVFGFFQKGVKTPQGNQMIVSGEGMASMLKAGAPDLPMYPISMIIGDKAEMKVSVVKSEYVDFENIEVAPSKGNFSRQINPNDVEYTFGEMYSQNAFYPSEQVALEKPFILRDFRGQNLMVYPYAYNPITKTLRVYTDLRISVKKVGDNGVNQKTSKRRTNSVDPETKASYERRFINYPSNERYSFIEDEGEMLIICVDEYKEALQPLVEWKNISGRPTTLALASETGTLDEMKRYITHFYETHENLKYVLLVGEYSELPPYEICTILDGMSNFGKSDNYYGMLEGDDFYEDVLVGRLSVESLEDAENQVNRIIYYERDIDETATWLSKGAGISANEGGGHYGEREYEHIDLIRDTLLNYTYTEISQRYDGVGSYMIAAADIAEDINKGVGIITYCDHGEELKWVLADFDTQCVHNLTNDNMLPFIWTVSCLNGHFDVDECFAESWLRAINPETNAPVGAVGGMFSWIYQPWVPPLYGQDEMVAILTEWRGGYNHTFGGASLNGNMYILDMCPEDKGYTHNSWLLFGDPSMMLRTEAPEQMNVTCSSSNLIVGMSRFIVNADTDFGIATLSKDGEIIASSYIKNGQANLTFSELKEEGTLKLVVTGYNKVTAIMDVEVKSATGPFVIYNDHNINQEDGQIDYSEAIDLSLNVKNIGTKGTNDISVEIVPKTDYVEMIENEAVVSSMAINEIVEIKDTFKFVVSDNVPDQEELPFDVKCYDGNETWTSAFSITANAPKFVVDTVYVRNELKPGSSGALVISVKNEGHSEAKNVVTEIYSCSSDVEFENTSISTESVKAGETFEIVTDLNVSEDAVNGTIYKVAYKVVAGEYTIESYYFITVGVSFEGFESGDFQTYDWKFEGNADWVISTNPYEGTYCAQSGDINDSEISTMMINVELPTETEISFYYKTACDYYDKLFFFVDDEEYAVWRGNNSPTNWEQVSFIIPKGNHDLKWMYKKDKTDSFSEDCVYVDNIVLPPLNVVDNTNVSELNKVNVEIYPNPASDVIYVNIEKPFDAAIYNCQGQMVKRMNDNNGKINVADLLKGIYFIEIRTENNVIVKKVLVK